MFIVLISTHPSIYLHPQAESILSICFGMTSSTCAYWPTVDAYAGMLLAMQMTIDLSLQQAISKGHIWLALRLSHKRLQQHNHACSHTWHCQRCTGLQSCQHSQFDTC